MSRNVVYILFVTTAILLVSCKKGKRNKDGTPITDSTFITADTFSKYVLDTTLIIPTIAEEKKELAKQVLPIWQKQLAYHTFKGKAKMHYEGMGQKQDFTANVRMTRDSAIWIHISAGMGIVNVARILITPDSIRMVNYLEKSVTEMPASEANKLLPTAVDFAVLQNLLVGEVLNRDGQITDVTDLPQFWNLQVTDTGMSQQLTYNKVDSTLFTLQMLSVTGKNNVAGRIQYKEYQDVINKRFATARVVNINDNGRTHYLEMNFNGVQFDVPMSFPFSVPSSYERKN